MKKPVSLGASGPLSTEFAQLKSMTEWLPQDKRQDFTALIERVEKALVDAVAAQKKDVDQVDPDSKATVERSPIAAIDLSVPFHSSSIMIFESPAAKSQHPTATDNSSPNEFYCDEQEQARALKEQYRRAAIMKDHFSPIIEAIDQGSTEKKSYRRPQKPLLQASTRRKKYNYLEGVRPYLY